MELNFFILGGIGIWLLILSLVVFWIFRYFQRLSKQVDKGNLLKLLEKILVTEEKNTKDIKGLRKEIEEIVQDSEFHIQKLGLIRFNPFEEMGGDHSFSLALLDGKEDGVIITGLHARERTRLYVKNIKRGKSRLELSDEEKRALKLALKNK